MTPTTPCRTKRTKQGCNKLSTPLDRQIIEVHEPRFSAPAKRSAQKDDTNVGITTDHGD